MSNTAIVSPYDSDLRRAGVSILAASAAGVAVAKFLSNETVEDKKAVAHLKEEQRRERLAAAKPVEATLHIPEPQSLIRAAQSLGYRLEPLAKPGAPLQEQPQLLLQDDHGRQMMLRPGSGKLVVTASDGAQAIQSVVHQHTLEAVAAHFGTKWTGVKTRKLANGIVEIEAKENDVSQSGGAAKVRAQVQPDGKVHVDIDEMKGNRCEKILSELAKSVGGEPTKIEKKPAFWQLPGKKTKSNIKV